MFSIIDNGAGIPMDLREHIFTDESSGYGLKNVCERIKLFYGDEFGPELDNDIKEGTCIRIRIAVIQEMVDIE